MEISKKLLDRLKSAYAVVALTGAGISAVSGVPTFRGENGLWKKFRPEELANFQSFSRNPELVWEWYQWRRNIINNVKPNLGHYALVDLEKKISDFYVITQNVDNLHLTAGSNNVIELHGNITRNKCSKCGAAFTEEFDIQNGIPKCSDCGGLIRPDVIWFGEMLDQNEIQKAQDLAAHSEIFFSIGTSALVEPAASLPYIAKGNGAYVVEINPERTPLSDSCDEYISESADKFLANLVLNF